MRHIDRPPQTNRYFRDMICSSCHIDQLQVGADRFPGHFSYPLLKSLALQRLVQLLNGVEIFSPNSALFQQNISQRHYNEA